MEKREVCNDPAMGFPENKIVLLNGNVLDGYLKTTPPDKIVSDDFKLDTTGRYLVFKKRKPTPKIPDELALEQEKNRIFFTQNAFFFLQHADIILHDSRMFLAPVAITNALDYIGENGFKSPTLGIYLEWWLYSFASIWNDETRGQALIYHLTGSPLSGMNKCSCVYADGTTQKIELDHFSAAWRSFMEINRRYTESKQIFEAYTLQEVWEKIHRS